MRGLHHVALWVEDSRFAAAVDFYTRLVGMEVDWQPDDDNIYLSSGADNLALHRADSSRPANAGGPLDHIGFLLGSAGDVTAWHDFLAGEGVPIAKPPKTHRDGSCSFYCRAPCGTMVQFIHHPSLAAAAPG